MSAAEHLLDGLGIKHVVVEHPPIFTIAEGIDAGVVAQLGVPVEHLVKCLLLRNTHDDLFLAVAAGEGRVDLKAVARCVGSTRLSFANAETMHTTLGSEPGSASLFDLYDNDHASDVRVIIDERIPGFEGDIGFHDGGNTRTLLFEAVSLPRVAKAIDPLCRFLPLHTVQ